MAAHRMAECPRRGDKAVAWQPTAWAKASDEEMSSWHLPGWNLAPSFSWTNYEGHKHYKSWLTRCGRPDVLEAIVNVQALYQLDLTCVHCSKKLDSWHGLSHAHHRALARLFSSPSLGKDQYRALPVVSACQEMIRSSHILGFTATDHENTT